MRAVIFDLGGTLLDMQDGIYWQFEQLSKEFDGAPASRKEIAAAMHGTTAEVVRQLIKNSDTPFDTIMRRHEDLRQQSIEHTKLYPGVGELLPIMRRVGIRLAAVTTDDLHSEKLLQNIGIHKYFDVIITAERVTQPKPHPESIHKILDELGISADDAAIVGDMIDDIIAGKNAKLAKTIAVTHGFGSLDDIKEARPDHIIEDIPSLLDVLDARVGA
jgi:phosphoglycolate phosphatase